MKQKLLISYLFITAFFLLINPAYAEHASAVWTYNGTNTEGGFLIEQKLPSDTEWTQMFVTESVQVRSASWDFEPTNGRTEYRLFAFTGDQRSEPSLAAFEYSSYSANDGLMTPNILIYFTNPPEL